MRYFLIGLVYLSHSFLWSQTYFPPKFSDEWETIDPTTLGFCQENIDELYTYLQTAETKSFILLKDGKIVLEQYFDDGAIDKTWPWYSAGKCMTATLVGIAQEEGLFDITDTTSDYLGEGWTSLTPQQEEKITIWHQLTMTTGLDETEFSCIDPSCLTYVTDPETRWVYHNGPYSLLRAVIDSTSGVNYNTYTNQKLANKIGMKLSAIWIKLGDFSFFYSTARDMARFGWLIANDGVWDGTTVLGDLDYINAMRSPSQALNPSYGYLWWLNGQSSFIGPDDPTSYPGPIGPDSPQDTYTAAGSQGQYISISPSTGYILIRQGTSSDESLAPINLLDNIWERVLSLDCPVTGINDTEYPNHQAYPNPINSNELFMPENTNSYQLFSSEGVLIDYGHETQVIDLEGLNPGVYYLKIEINEKVVTQKIIRQ